MEGRVGHLLASTAQGSMTDVIHRKNEPIVVTVAASVGNGIFPRTSVSRTPKLPSLPVFVGKVW